MNLLEKQLPELKNLQRYQELQKYYQKDIITESLECLDEMKNNYIELNDLPQKQCKTTINIDKAKVVKMLAECIANKQLTFDFNNIKNNRDTILLLVKIDIESPVMYQITNVKFIVGEEEINGIARETFIYNLKYIDNFYLFTLSITSEKQSNLCIIDETNKKINIKISYVTNQQQIQKAKSISFILLPYVYKDLKILCKKNEIHQSIKSISDVQIKKDRFDLHNEDIKAKAENGLHLIISYKGVEIASLDKIQELEKLNCRKNGNKFKKFYNFLLDKVNTIGLDCNSNLVFKISEWLEYTNRETSEKMQKVAKKEIETYCNILKNVELRDKITSNGKLENFFVIGINTKARLKGYVKIGIYKDFIDYFKGSYYILPYESGQLSNNAYSFLDQLMYYCFINCKNNKPFTIKYNTLCKWANIPSAETVKDNHKRNYDIYIYDPVDAIIKELRDKLGDKIKIDNYRYPNKPSDIYNIDLKITISGIDMPKRNKKRKKSR